MKVRIVSEGGHSYGTRVLQEDGSEISGVTGITFRAEVGDICRAELELGAVELHAGAWAKVLVRGKEVRRIEYADGTVDEFPE